MFDYKTDRLNYGELITPPIGYKLNKAIATTYSLEFETLTAASLALGLNESTDSQLLNSKVCAFNVIDKISQKMIVFCEAGQIHMPYKPSPLHMLFEKSIIPVALPEKRKSKFFPSFHPKTWLLEYEPTDTKDTKKLYRFIVMSRNLTSDRSWDVSVMLEGEETKSKNSKSNPIKSFLSFLSDQINTADPDKRQKSNLINELINKIEHVGFYASTNGKPFSDYEIFALGISNDNNSIWQNDNMFDDTTCHDITVVSPFITKDTIELLNSKLCRLQGCGKSILITRRTELPKIKDVSCNFDVFVMKDDIIDGEDNLPENTEIQANKRQDIHAKLYVYRKYSDVYLYIGSMNATERGTGLYKNDDIVDKAMNVELMVKLKTNNYYLNTNKFRHEVIGDDENKSPFQKVDLDSLNKEDSSTDTTNELLQNIKKICRLNLTAKVQEDCDSYSIHIQWKNKDNIEGITIAPLYAQGLEIPFDYNMSFEGLVINQLSELYVIKSSDGTNCVEKIILIPTKGIPKERDKSIIKYAISNSKDFSDYVAFVLGDDSILTMSEIIDEVAKCGNYNNNKTAPMPSLYERMIKVACNDPMRLKEIHKVIEAIDDNTIVPKEFNNMYETFMKALKLCPKK